MPKHTPSERKASRKKRLFREVFNNPPEVTKETERKKGKEAARKQKIAIALSKLRKGKKK
jgi:hypothetical protein